MVNFGEQLQKVKESRGLSIHDLVEITGVSEETLQMIEHNTFDGEISTLIQISDALNITFQIGNTTI